MQILIVCSANQCRSPMAAALLRARFTELDGAAEITSAGFGPPDWPAAAGAITVMSEVGLDLGEHRSRAVRPQDCRHADLIIGMTRQHVVGVVTEEPGAWPRTFPIVDLVRRALQIGARPADEPVETWVRRAHGGRTPAGVLALPARSDISDPVGAGLSAFRRTRDQLTELTGELARSLIPCGARPRPPARSRPA